MTVQLRNIIDEEARAWYMNNGFIIRPRYARYNALLAAFGVTDLAHVQDDALKDFRKELDNLITGGASRG